MKDKTVECEVERLLAVIGGKWKVLILRELFSGTGGTPNCAARFLASLKKC